MKKISTSLLVLFLLGLFGGNLFFADIQPELKLLWGLLTLLLAIVGIIGLVAILFGYQSNQN